MSIQWLTVRNQLLVLGQVTFGGLRRVVELLIERLVVGATIHITDNLMLKLLLYQSIELSHRNMPVFLTACVLFTDVAITSLSEDTPPSRLLLHLNYHVPHFDLTFCTLHNFKADSWLGLLRYS